jgi:hypothetical protein
MSWTEILLCLACRQNSARTHETPTIVTDSAFPCGPALAERPGNKLEQSSLLRSSHRRNMAGAGKIPPVIMKLRPLIERKVARPTPAARRSNGSAVRRTAHAPPSLVAPYAASRSYRQLSGGGWPASRRCVALHSVSSGAGPIWRGAACCHFQFQEIRPSGRLESAPSLKRSSLQDQIGIGSAYSYQLSRPES